jgi:hypothetical protein
MKDIHCILIYFFYDLFDEVKIVLDLKRFDIFTQPSVCHTLCVCGAGGGDVTDKCDTQLEEFISFVAFFYHCEIPHT